ncbi:hypothetical protein ACWGGS_38860 [Streptomyces decoyicus]
MDKTIFLIPGPLASAYAVSRDILTKAAAVTEHSPEHRFVSVCRAVGRSVESDRASDVWPLPGVFSGPDAGLVLDLCCDTSASSTS